MLQWVKGSARCGWFGRVLPFLGLYSILRGRRRTSGRAWQNSRSKIKFKGPSLKHSQSSDHYQVLKFCQETCVTSSYLESWEVVPSCFKTAAGRWLNRSADCMPEVAIKRYQACYRSGAVVGRGSLAPSLVTSRGLLGEFEKWGVRCLLSTWKSRALQGQASQPPPRSLHPPLSAKLSLAKNCKDIVGYCMLFPRVWFLFLIRSPRGKKAYHSVVFLSVPWITCQHFSQNSKWAYLQARWAFMALICSMAASSWRACRRPCVFSPFWGGA